MDRKEKEKEIEFYEKVRKLADSSVNKLKAQLAEAEKPKLRHGVGAIVKGGDPFIIIEDKAIFKDRTQFSFNEISASYQVLIPDIFKELEALQEPIDGFHVNDVYGRPVDFTLIDNGKVRISMACGYNDVFIEAFNELILNCCRMQAKLKAEKE